MGRPKRKKPCKWCQEPFLPVRPFQTTCQPFPCAIEYAKEKEREKAKKVNKCKLKEYRDNDLRRQIKMTQVVFNKLIRILDKLEPCISCARSLIECSVGGSWDCGHYKTIGAFPELRFCFLNAHKQCKSCNGGSGNFTRKNKTVVEDYTDRLIARIGQNVVDWLNGPHKSAKYTCSQLIQMRSTYSKEIRLIKSGSPPSRNWRVYGS